MNHASMLALAQVAEDVSARYFVSWNAEHVPVEPVAVSSSLYAELHAVPRVLAGLAAVAARRLAPSPRHLADLLGRTDGSAPLLPDHWLPPHREVVSARPDCIVERGRIRVVELNCHSAIGSVPYAERLTGAYLEQDPGRWQGHLPFPARLQSLLELRTGLHPATPRVSILGASNDPDVRDTRFFSDEADYGRAQGADVEYIDVAGLDDPGVLNGSDVLLRVGMSGAWMVEAPAVLTWLAESWLSRRRLPGLVVSDTAALLEDKAMLHHLSTGSALTPAERAFCSRHLPWTRMLRDEVTTGPDGTSAPLVRHVLARRADIVLKKCDGTQGRDVIFGASTMPEDWARQVESIMSGGPRWIAQQVVRSDSFPTRTVGSSGEVTMVRCDPVLSPSLFGEHDGGVLARYAPPGGDRVVSVLHGCVVGVAMVERG